ncbi:MAG: hypothetical protein JWQ43_3689 [Glaciihabitans sp.]|nr:hypothetical protein [Glaciihabitans sp.]
MYRRSFTVRVVLAWFAILVAVGGFVGATWYGVSQVLLAPVITSVQRGLSDVTEFADTLDGVTEVTSTSIGRGPTREADRDGYAVLALEPELAPEDTVAVANELVDWLDAREEISQVRLHVTLDRDGSQITLSSDAVLNDDRFALYTLGTDDAELAGIAVNTDVADGSYNLDDSNDDLRVVLTPLPGVDTAALRERWAAQLLAVSATGTLVIDETSAEVDE